MIIKIIPEEGEKTQEVVHYGVKEFLMFGNKISNEQNEDFHDWNGSYKYLMGSLYFYLNQVREKFNTEEIGSPLLAGQNVPTLPSPPQNGPDLNVMSVNNDETIDNPEGGMLKKVTANNPDLKIVGVSEEDLDNSENPVSIVNESEEAEDIDETF